MKNKPFLFIVLCLLIFALLAGCSSPAVSSCSVPQAATSLPASTPSTAEAEPSGTVSPSGVATLFIASPEEPNLPELGTPVEFVQTPDGFDVLIWSDQDISEIHFNEGSTFEEGSIKPIPGESLFVTTNLPAFTPLKVTMLPWGDLSYFSVTIMFANGSTGTYFIGISGRDGSLYLFQNEE